jgi:hypothetical protein
MLSAMSRILSHDKLLDKFRDPVELAKSSKFSNKKTYECINSIGVSEG